MELTDAEIIEQVATKIMKWKKVVRDSGRSMWVNEENYGMAYTQNYLNEASGTMDFAWNPLTDWQDTMQVLVRVMNPMGIQVLFTQDGGAAVEIVQAPLGVFRKITVDDDNAQRAICLAALKTLSPCS